MNRQLTRRITRHAWLRVYHLAMIAAVIAGVLLDVLSRGHP